MMRITLPEQGADALFSDLSAGDLVRVHREASSGQFHEQFKRRVRIAYPLALVAVAPNIHHVQVEGSDDAGKDEQAIQEIGEQLLAERSAWLLDLAGRPLVPASNGDGGH
jgi:hypothetical protein